MEKTKRQSATLKVTKTRKKSVHHPAKEKVLLSIAGRGKMENYGKPILIYLRKDIQNDIKKYCAGTKQSVINYLLRKSLDDLIKKNVLVVAEKY